MRSLVLLLAGALRLSSQTDPEEDVKRLVVRLEAEFGDSSSFGAGIITGVSRETDRIYIATANHTVRRGGEKASRIQVSFRSLPGEKLPGKLLEPFDSRSDLAVISVAGLKENFGSVSLPFTRVGRSTDLKRKSNVFALGFPNGKGWYVSAKPDVVSAADGSLRFESQYLAPGNSGGALLNDRYEIVGMVLNDSPPESEALRIESILATLREWGFEPSLRAVSRNTPASSSATTLRLVRIDVKQDGSAGDTDWEFQCTANGKVVFDWKKRTFNDKAPHNRVIIQTGEAKIELQQAGDLQIVITGNQVGTSKQATGKGVLSGDGQVEVPVRAEKEGDGSFVFVFERAGT